MKNSLLLPNKYKVIGWVIFLLFITLGIFCMLIDFKIQGFQIYNFVGGSFFGDYNLTNEFAVFGITIGLLIIVFTKEKIEDEFINACRLKAFKVAFVSGIIYYLQDAFGTYSGALINSSFYLLMMQIGVYCIIFYILKAGLTHGK